MDVINPDKLCVYLFKGFDFTGGGSKFPFFPWETDVAVITVLRYCAACETLYSYLTARNDDVLI